MSSSLQFYLALLLVYAGVDLIACWGLNLQMGIGGIVNFGFVLFQAAGAYTYAILTLGAPAHNAGAGAGFQTYFWGARLPFPLPFVGAIVVGGLLSVVVGLLVLPRLRGDYQAIALLVVSLVASGLILNDASIFNGANGLSSIPRPLEAALGLSGLGYSWAYVGFTGVLCILSGWVVWQISRSPLGRVLRAVREDEEAAKSLGKNPRRLRLIAFVGGGMLAGLSGAVLVAYIDAWAPSSWGYVETFVFVTAVIVGGFGSNVGVAVGVVLVPIVFGEAPLFLPSLVQASWFGAVQLILFGLFTMGFLWVRPQGVRPERRVKYAGRIKKLGASVAVAGDGAGRAGERGGTQ